MKADLRLGDCLKVLRELPESSIDSIVTDPPYGLGFMGKKWDYSVPSVDIWGECLRVLKPGGHLLAFAGTRTQHRMACNIENAGFEIRDMIAWVYGCYSEDTEVLTKRGWLKYSSLAKEDLILQWDCASNKLSWCKPKNYFEYSIEDDMVLFENRHTSQLVTQNHTVLAKIRKHSRNSKPTKYEKIDARDIRKNWQIDLPLAGDLDSGVKIEHPYLVGWWLTDAWGHKDGKACMFSQSKLKTLDKLRNYLSENNIKFSEYTKDAKKTEHKDEHTFYTTGNVPTYLLTEYPNRELTWNMLLWDKESRFQLLEGLLDGDGSRDESRGYSEVFWSLKRDRLDIVQAICVSLNIRSHIDYAKGCIYLNRNHNSTQLQAKHKKPLQHYKGKVWCLETETGAFVVRRNGRAFISGNSGFPKSLDVSKSIDKAAGAERKIIGKGTSGKTAIWQAGGMGDFNITATATEAAKQWAGWGTSLKPALKPITLARKPFKGTVAANVLAHGTGAINVDGCRVEGETWHRSANGTENISTGACYGDRKRIETESHPQGRWPANLIHDGSDEVLNIFPNNSSRFFYCAKASKRDRDEGCEGLEEKIAGGLSGRSDGSLGSVTMGRNPHPTVKPTDLMGYLCRLITPPNGIVLDPFMGSGSTGKAAMLEGFDFIGIEISEEYFEIAEARIKRAKDKWKKIDLSEAS